MISEVKDVQSLPPALRFLLRYLRLEIFIVLCGLYAVAFFCVRAPSGGGAAPIVTTEAKIVKLVDVQEYIPPPPTKVVEFQEQPAASEIVQEVDEIQQAQAQKTNLVEANETIFAGAEDWSKYVGQQKISDVPEIPIKDVLAKIDYPSMAHKQGIEGVVYLELYIDDEGNIRRIEVLKDPGHGFAQAAIAAFDGIKCKPALQNGKPIAVRFRYPVRFSLKK